jgi:acyl-CoA thioesterase-1
MKRHAITWMLAALMLAAAAAAAAKNDFANQLKVHNKGIGGQNARDGLKRFDKDVAALKPDYVLIYFGLNDTLNEKKFIDTDEYIANLEKMIDAAGAAKITPVLATIHHVDVEALLKRHKKEAYGDEGPQKKIDRYNARLHQLAERKQVKLVDWCGIMDRAMAADADVAYRNADGVHLNPPGNQLLARSFYDTIAADLRDGQTIVCLGDSVTFGATNQGAGTAGGDTYPACLRRIEIK